MKKERRDTRVAASSVRGISESLRRALGCRCHMRSGLLLAAAGAIAPHTALALEFEISSLLHANGGDGSQGYVLGGVSPISLSAGDVNHDGSADVIVGVPEYNLNGVGQTYVSF